MKLSFRKLRADEITCRIGQIKENGLTLLLYKDARCDMNILDETVGEMNWKREHTRDNRNCVVSIWDEDKQQWTDATNQLGITWPQVSDLQGWDNAAAVKYEVKGIPFTVIVDSEGKILKAGLRGDELKAFVAETLAK